GAAERRPAAGAELVGAAVDREAARARAADAGLTHVAQVAPLVERAFERVQLVIARANLVDLLRDQVVALAFETAQVEHQAAEVAHLQLAQLAQVAQAATHTSARAEAGTARLRRGDDGLRRGVRLRRRGALL